jgi:hypothetical protein
MYHNAGSAPSESEKKAESAVYGGLPQKKKGDTLWFTLGKKRVLLKVTYLMGDTIGAWSPSSFA